MRVSRLSPAMESIYREIAREEEIRNLAEFLDPPDMRTTEEIQEDDDTNAKLGLE